MRKRSNFSRNFITFVLQDLQTLFIRAGISNQSSNFRQIIHTRHRLSDFQPKCGTRIYTKMVMFAFLYYIRLKTIRQIPNYLQKSGILHKTLGTTALLNFNWKKNFSWLPIFLLDQFHFDLELLWWVLFLCWTNRTHFHPPTLMHRLCIDVM